MDEGVFAGSTDAVDPAGFVRAQVGFEQALADELGGGFLGDHETPGGGFDGDVGGFVVLRCDDARACSRS